MAGPRAARRNAWYSLSRPTLLSAEELGSRRSHRHSRDAGGLVRRTCLCRLSAPVPGTRRRRKRGRQCRKLGRGRAGAAPRSRSCPKILPQAMQSAASVRRQRTKGAHSVFPARPYWSPARNCSGATSGRRMARLGIGRDPEPTHRAFARGAGHPTGAHASRAVKRGLRRLGPRPITETIHQRFVLTAVDLDHRPIDHMHQRRGQHRDKICHFLHLGDATERD